MKPVYFPFTTIAEPALTAVAACFGPPVIYQAWGRIPEFLAKWAEEGRVDIRVPIAGDEDHLGRVLHEFRQWSEAHRGADTRFFKTQRQTIPFFNESSRTQILRDIRTRADEKPAAPPTDPLFDSRLFLQIAQQWDLQNQEVDQDLKAIQSSEMALQRHMKGPEESELSVERSSDPLQDLGSHMTLERLRAWARILAGAEEIPGLLVTDSPAVFEAVLEKIPQPRRLLRQEGISSDSGLQASRETFLKNLEKLASEKDFAGRELSGPGTGSTGNISLELYLAPESSAMDIFARFFDRPDEFRKICKAPPMHLHTLIACVQWV
ncbi:MAG: hypothetical protein RBR01_07975 [Desulfobacterales bacterium]|jgi:hypothetical protein|nr:hypothetical protein [Desulfobacterales bacterium]